MEKALNTGVTPRVKIVSISGHVCSFDESDYNLLSKLGGMSVCVKPCGYKTLVFSSGTHVTRYVHRILLGAKLGEEVDHKDGNTLNGTRDNIRIASSQQNKFNRDISKSKKSGLPKGVTKHGTSYKATITHNYTKYTLGTFVTVNEAAEAYKKAAEKYQGEFASHNRK